MFFFLLPYFYVYKEQQRMENQYIWVAFEQFI